MVSLYKFFLFLFFSYWIFHKINNCWSNNKFIIEFLSINFIIKFYCIYYRQKKKKKIILLICNFDTEIVSCIWQYFSRTMAIFYAWVFSHFEDFSVVRIFPFFFNDSSYRYHTRCQELPQVNRHNPRPPPLQL